MAGAHYNAINHQFGVFTCGHSLMVQSAADNSAQALLLENCNMFSALTFECLNWQVKCVVSPKSWPS